MTELILARHGETKWNVEEVFRGTIDIELNETGVKQAKLLAEHLSTSKIDAIYSSPLKRALETAQIIAHPHRLEVEISPELIDLDFGEWQGLSLRQVEDRYQELYAEWANNPQLVKMPSGESLNDATKRALKLVKRVVAEHDGTVVMASHRVVSKVLICALLGLDNSHFWNIRQDTCATTTFAYEKGRFVLTGHNDTSYLKPLHHAPPGDF